MNQISPNGLVTSEVEFQLDGRIRVCLKSKIDKITMMFTTDTACKLVDIHDAGVPSALAWYQNKSVAIDALIKLQRRHLIQTMVPAPHVWTEYEKTRYWNRVYGEAAFKLSKRGERVASILKTFIESNPRLPMEMPS